MIIVGITGGSGCGKSYVSSTLSNYKLYHMDCDKIARIVVEPGMPCLIELCEFFGNEILNEDNSLNRKKLASIAFSTNENTEKLNEITLKYIVKYIKDTLIELENRGETAVLIDGATLIESNLHKICNINLAVIAPKEARIERIMERDSLTLEEATKRINAQKEDSFYVENCDFVLVNNQDLESLNAKINVLFNLLNIYN